MKRITTALMFIVTLMAISCQSHAATPFDGKIGWYAGFDVSPSDVVANGGQYVVSYYRGQSAAYVTAYLDSAYSAGLDVALELPNDAVENEDTAAITSFVNTYKNHSALVAWYLYDEPTNSSTWRNHCQVAYNAIKSVSSKPVILCFNDDNGSVSDFSSAYDIVFFDCYLCFRGDIEGYRMQDRGALWWFKEGFNTKIDNVASQAASAGKPWVLVTQAFGWSDEYPTDWRLPTPLESKFMNHYAMRQGACSVNYWCYSWAYLSRPLANEAYVWSGYTWITSTASGEDVLMSRLEENTAIGDAVVAGEVSGAVSSDKWRIYANVYQTSGGDYYLCLINRTDVDENVTIDLNVGSYTRVQLQFEGTSPITTLNGSQQFTTSMGDFRVKWFKLLP